MARFIPNLNTYVGFTPGPVGTMSAPSGLTATEKDGNGSLDADSYSYIITGFNGTGETVGSDAATVTTTETGGVQLSWTKLDGADGYRIYGRTSGSEKLIAQVGAVTTWLDTGALSPATSTPPTTGTASNMASPTVDDVNEAVDITEYVSGLNFGAQGNTVPTPNLRKLFETSIEGTSQATATIDCYRDDEIDTAWELLPRGTKGYIILSRRGGKPNTVGDKCEVWPIHVSSRTNSNLASNTPVAFTVTFSVADDPAEDAVVVAAA